MLKYLGHYDVELYVMECGGIINIENKSLCL